MIKGLQVAGQNPTRASFMTGLRGVTSYDDEGVLPSPVSFALTQFGQYPANSCAYFVQLKGTAFVAAAEGMRDRDPQLGLRLTTTV